MKDSISTPGAGALGVVRALSGGASLGRGSGNKKARAKLKKKVNVDKKKTPRRK